MVTHRILNGTGVYGCAVNGGTEAEFVLTSDAGPVVLRIGLTTLGALLETGERVLDQARVIAEARAEAACRS